MLGSLIADSWSLDRLAGAASFEALANIIAEMCAELAHAEICTLWHVFNEGSSQQLKLAGAYGTEAPQTIKQDTVYKVEPPNLRSYDGLTSHIASNRACVHVHSYQELVRDYAFCHRGFMDASQWKGKPEELLRNLYGMPLLLGDELEGVLKVENRMGSDGFTEEDIATLHRFAQIAALALKTLGLRDSYDQEVFEVPVRMSGVLIQRPADSEVAQEIVNATASVLNAGVCSLWLVDDARERLVHRASFGIDQKDLLEIPFYRIDITPPEGDDGDAQIEGVTAWVAIRKRSFWANTHQKLREHKSWRGTWDRMMWGSKEIEIVDKQFHGMYAVPLIWNSEVLGVLKVENALGQKFFSLNDRRKCDLMANYIVLLLVLTRQLKSQLVPIIAHNLNAPARGIAKNISMLTRELDGPSPSLDRIRDMLAVMKGATFTLVNMSRTLAAEVARHGLPQSRISSSILDVLRETKEQIEPLLMAGQSLTFSTVLQELMLDMTASELVWLHIVLFNLLHNASKHTPGAGVIELTCRADDSDFVIAVADHGPGVPADHKPHIFEPLYRVTPTGRNEGLGLGLYEVKKLLELLGWSIQLHDVRPHGARFEIHVPRAWRGARA